MLSLSPSVLTFVLRIRLRNRRIHMYTDDPTQLSQTKHQLRVLAPLPFAISQIGTKAHGADPIYALRRVLLKQQ